ncbi:MAG TPA: hypothetical protein DCF45_13570 [Gammaproteobacteria bacterium]|nr:hypothetical protein [Gammaproteobacteria bacterium]
MIRLSGLVKASALTMTIASASSLAGEAAPSLMFDLQPVFDARCVQCHLLESPQGGLVLENGEAHFNLVDTPSTQVSMPRVAPGDPQQSYLIHKMRGSHIEAGGSGQPMPFGNESSVGMPAKEIELIERWITAGAPDN